MVVMNMTYLRMNAVIVVVSASLGLTVACTPKDGDTDTGYDTGFDTGETGFDGSGDGGGGPTGGGPTGGGPTGG